MHVRFSSCLGSPVYEHGGEEVLGVFSGMLIHPDSGKLEGIFIAVPHFLHAKEVFCLSVDIVHWGLSIQIRSAEALALPEDLVRLQPLFDDPRTVLGQKIRTESGRVIGTCKDIQFDTERMRMEWLFPKKFLRWGVAMPVTEIVEIKPEAIIIRDAATPVEEPAAPEVAPAIPGLPETGVTGPTTTRHVDR